MYTDGGRGELLRDRPAAGRVGLVTRLLLDALDITSDDALDTARAPSIPDVRILDCGGGSGAYAVPLALAGCDVTVVDISADALATLRRRADEAGVPARVHGLSGDVERLGDSIDGDRFDAVLAHGVLDAVDAVPATFSALVAATRPDGLLSLLVANPLAAVLARAVVGEPAQALAELRALDSGRAEVDPDAVVALCDGAGLRVVARHGIGFFSDLVPGASLDTPGARQALAELDAATAGRPPFADLAARIHLLARRPPIE